MASEPAQPRTSEISTSRESHQSGGISLLRSQLATQHALQTTSDNLQPTPVAAISNCASQAPDLNSMPPTNPYAGVPPLGGGGPRGGGSIRNPNNPCDFLPNTQIILRGGFAPLPRYVPDGDPDNKFLAPHYPPKSNDFYELTSDGRLSEVYFENARIRRFRANPGLSILSAELSPAASETEGEKAPLASITVQENRIYIGQGFWRQADEKIFPMQENKQPAHRHKHEQKPTQVGIRPWQQTWRREPRTNEEFWRASEMTEDDYDAFQEPKKEQTMRGNNTQATTQEEVQRSPRKVAQHSIHHSAEGANKDIEQPKRTQSEADIRQGRDTLFERILEQYTAQPSRQTAEQGIQEPARDQEIYSIRKRTSMDQVISDVHQIQQEALTEVFPLYSGRHTNIPGDLSGNNSRKGRTKSDLEAMFLPEPTGEGPAASGDVSL